MRTRWLRYALIGLGAVALLAVVFGAGFVAGRASLRGGGALGRGLFFTGAHGAAGVIQEIQGATLVVKLRDGTDQTILTDKNTRLERNPKRATLSDLKVGDVILVIGTPDAQGRILARMVRVPERQPPQATPTPGGL